MCCGMFPFNRMFHCVYFIPYFALKNYVFYFSMVTYLNLFREQSMAWPNPFLIGQW